MSVRARAGAAAGGPEPPGPRPGAAPGLLRPPQGARGAACQPVQRSTMLHRHSFSSHFIIHAFTLFNVLFINDDRTLIIAAAEV